MPDFNRHAGLIVLDVTMSNPNGDPDMESEPRTRELDGLGMISPVSVKRKFRDLVGAKSEVFLEAKKQLSLGEQTGNKFGILEERGRKREEIKKLSAEDFKRTYWDARLFGNTFLESLKDADENEKNAGAFDHFINTGVIQVGVGLSVAPVDIVRMTNTNKAGVQEGKDRGMAPLAFRVVQHGIYTIPFFVNPGVAEKTGATREDLKLFEYILPYIYLHTASAVRPQVSILHAWVAEHKNALGSCPEHLLVNALVPRVKPGVERPSSMNDYEIPMKSTLEKIKSKFKRIDDLMENLCAS